MAKNTAFLACETDFFYSTIINLRLLWGKNVMECVCEVLAWKPTLRLNWFGCLWLGYTWNLLYMELSKMIMALYLLFWESCCLLPYLVLNLERYNGDTLMGFFICRILIAKLELHLLAGLKSGDLYQHHPAFETLASHTHTAWCNQTIMRKGQWLRPSRTSPYSHILSCWVCIKPPYRTEKWWGARKGFWLSNKFSKDEISLLFFFCCKFQSIDFSKEEKESCLSISTVT